MSEEKSVIWKRNSRETKLKESSVKKMKLDDDDLPDSQVFRSSSLAYSASDSGDFSAALSGEDDHRSSSFSSSSEETNEIATNTRLPFLDLEEVNQISETEISTLINNNFRKQASPVLSENLGGETSEMDSATTEKDDRRKPKKKTEKSPTKAEIDDFFSAAEKHEQKRFTEKYNYDFVNDTPLEGRYQWLTLKP